MLKQPRGADSSPVEQRSKRRHVSFPRHQWLQCHTQHPAEHPFGGTCVAGGCGHRGESYTFVISNPSSFLVSNVGVPCLASLQDYASPRNHQHDHCSSKERSFKYAIRFHRLRKSSHFVNPSPCTKFCSTAKVKAYHNEAKESYGQLRPPTRLILEIVERVTKNPRRNRSRWGFRFRV